jgi:hypothetical protein
MWSCPRSRVPAQSLAQLLGVGMFPPLVIAVFLKEGEGCGELLRGFFDLAEPRQVHTIDPDGSYWRNSTKAPASCLPSRIPIVP